MADGFNGGKIFGTALIVTGVALGVVALAWLGVNVASGVLQPGGFMLGLFFLMLFILPLVLVGFFIRRKGAKEAIEEEVFNNRRRLFEKDRLFRQTLLREARQAVELLKGVELAAGSQELEMLQQARRTLEGLAEDVSQPLSEADWLHSIALDDGDEQDIERYGDLLLAGIRKISRIVGSKDVLETASAHNLLELAGSIQRQYALRQDLVVRGRKVPAASPLRLLKAELPGRGRIDLESIEPGDAVSYGDKDYLVTAHASYFCEDQHLNALLLRGEEGVRWLLEMSGGERLLFMEPVEVSQLEGSVERSGTASVSIESLSGKAEGIVVDYRLVVGPNDRAGWWERWPEGERAYAGHSISHSEIQLWPSAVG